MFVEDWPRALLPVVLSHMATGAAPSGRCEWCGRSYRRPGLPAAVARDNTTRRERLAKGSFAKARVRSAKATVLAEALGTLQSRRGPLSNSPIEWSTDTSA